MWDDFRKQAVCIYDGKLYFYKKGWNSAYMECDNARSWSSQWSEPEQFQLLSDKWSVEVLLFPIWKHSSNLAVVNSCCSFQTQRSNLHFHLQALTYYFIISIGKFMSYNATGFHWTIISKINALQKRKNENALKQLIASLLLWKIPTYCQFA